VEHVNKLDSRLAPHKRDKFPVPIRWTSPELVRFVQRWI